MGKPRNASLILDHLRGKAAYDLYNSPKSYNYQGRDLDGLDEESEEYDRMDAGVGEEQEVGAEHAGYGPACTDHRHGGGRRDQCVGNRSCDPAEEVKKDKSDMAEPVFDVVAEDPEVEHVAEDMEKTAMHEHGGEERERGMDRLCGLHGDNIVRYRTIGIDDLPTVRTAQHLEDEDHNVQHNNRNGDNRERI